MRAMMMSAFWRWISSCASECATTAMSAAMPHSSALSARGAASAPVAAVSAAAVNVTTARNTAVRVRIAVSLLRGRGAAAFGHAAAGRAERAVSRFLRARTLVRCAGLGLGFASGGRVRRASGRAARAGVHAVVLVARELAVVVRVELGEARVQLGGVLRLVARDEAVVVFVQRVKAPTVARRAGGAFAFAGRV